MTVISLCKMSCLQKHIEMTLLAFPLKFVVFLPKNGLHCIFELNSANVNRIFLVKSPKHTLTESFRNAILWQSHCPAQEFAWAKGNL